MTADEVSACRLRAVAAVTALVDQLTKLTVCCDLLDVLRDHAVAREARRSLMAATTALHALRAALPTFEIVEHYLRADAEQQAGWS